MSNDPTLRAFLRLRLFSFEEQTSPLDRLAACNAAAWLAHATTYGITADPSLLQEIADPSFKPVARAITLTRELVCAMTEAGLPLTAPFQSVDLLYSNMVDEGFTKVEHGSASLL